MRVAILALSASLLPLLSCDKNKPAPSAFTWKASDARLETRPGEGSNSSKITDLWMYVNGQFQGAYPVGNPMPVITNDKPVEITVLAGIMNNGISGTRIPWQFYKGVVIDTTVEAGRTVTRPFTFQYDTSITFPLIDDFENTIGQNFTKSALADTGFTYVSSPEGFEGRSIKMGLAYPDVLAQIESSGDGFSLPAGNSNVYLELNYKCNHFFTVGLLDAAGTQRPGLHINAKEEWNKIYIRLAEAVNLPQTSTKYKLYFQMERGVTEVNPWVLLDNIKVLYL